MREQSNMPRPGKASGPWVPDWMRAAAGSPPQVSPLKARAHPSVVTAVNLLSRAGNPADDPNDALVAFLEDHLGLTDLDDQGDEIYAQCPNPEHHENNHDNWSINRHAPYLFHCFSPNCGYKGNLMQLVKDLRECDWREAKALIRSRGLSVLTKTDHAVVKEYSGPAPEQIEKLEAELATFGDPPVRALNQRGISAASAKFYGIRWDDVNDRWKIPICGPDGALWGVQSKRELWGSEAKSKTDVLNSPGVKKSSALFGLFEFLEGGDSGDLILVESPLDVVYLYERGFWAVASFGAKVSDPQLGLLCDIEPAVRVILALDNDPAGLKATEGVLEQWKGKLPLRLFSYGEDVQGMDPGELSQEEITRGVDDAEEVEPEVVQSSWSFTPNLKQVITGAVISHPADICEREDGQWLFYRRRVNVIAGEPESGKSLLGIGIAVQVIKAGGRVVFLDFEDSAMTTAGRLTSMGVDAVATAESQWQFIHADEAGTKEELENMREQIAAFDPDLVIVDSSNEAMSLLGLEINSTDAAVNFYRSLRKISESGPCVIIIDHVVKNPANRRGYAFGAMGKKSALTGIQYEVSIIDLFVPEKGGSCLLQITKDRPGAVNALADRKTRNAAIFRLEPNPDNTGTIPRFATPDAPDSPRDIRSDQIMECVKYILDALDEKNPQTVQALRQRVPSRLRGLFGEVSALLVADAQIKVEVENRKTRGGPQSIKNVQRLLSEKPFSLERAESARLSREWPTGDDKPPKQTVTQAGTRSFACSNTANPTMTV